MHQRHTYLSLLLILATWQTSLAQKGKPEWVTNNGKSGQYAPPMYLVGFGMALPQNGETEAQTLDKATDGARKSLIEGVVVSIKSLSELYQNNKSGDVLQIATQTYSAMEVEGIQRETYVDKQKSTYYALAYVPKDKVMRLYADKCTKLQTQANDLYKQAQAQEGTGKVSLALNSYVETQQALHQLEEASTILRALGGQYAASGGANVTPSQVREKISALYKKPVNSVNDLGFFLAFCLHSTLPEKTEGSVNVLPLNYQDSKFSSSFSRYFQNILQTQLADVSKLKVISPEATLGPDGKPKPGTVDYVLVGNYWELGDKIKFIATIRHLKSSKIVASAETTVPAILVAETQLPIKPENYINAQKDQKQFDKNDVVANDGLSLDIWTNKGEEGLLYTQGENMDVYVRSNIPCYIRLVYHLADGLRTILLDNYYIDMSKVNKVVKIPQQFECAAPFGAEVLQAIASTGEFPPIDTRLLDGYAVLAEDLPQFLDNSRTQSRGFKKKPDEARRLLAERRLTITTLKK